MERRYTAIFSICDIVIGLQNSINKTKNRRFSKYILKCLIQRKMAKNGGFGGCGGSATVSSQLNIVHTHESHHIKGEPSNFLI